jgi:hypothetical protein
MTADWVKPSLSKQLSVRFSLVVGSLYSPLDLCYMPTSQVYPDSSRLLALDNFCKPKGPRRALTPCRPPWTLSPGIYDLCSALLACHQSKLASRLWRPSRTPHWRLSRRRSWTWHVSAICGRYVWWIVAKRVARQIPKLYSFCDASYPCNNVFLMRAKVIHLYVLAIKRGKIIIDSCW